MRILTLTTLYPNNASPAHGVFVENRLRAFQTESGADIRVVAPVPWFPFSSKAFGRYAAFARAPLTEERFGVPITHPRYAIPPKVGMTYAVNALERCFLREVEKLLNDGWDFDLIDAHYLYPDGVAAVRAAKKLGKPVWLTARGTDVSLLPSFPAQREMILEAVREADGVICVAQALKDALIELGAPAEKIEVLRNGVDLETFKPLDQHAMRAKLALPADAAIIASVGHLIERKGHDITIDAISAIPDAHLLIVGAGEERSALERQAKKSGASDRIHFLGAVAHDQLCEIYSACDGLVLASSREGWPNVLLEAMACGAPAIAAPIWGCGEVITEPAAGRLAEARDADRFTDAINAVLASSPDRAATRRYAERFSWQETASKLTTLFQRTINEYQFASKIRCQPITPRSQTPRLIVTVDTEEAFDWDDFHKPAHTICPPEDIEPFQALCEEFNFKPIYFLSYPVLQDDRNAAYFRRLHESGRAEPGLHLHQWKTPPLEGFDGEYYSYQKNLPAQTHLEKLQNLATLFQARMGFRARAHRAGRYGIAPYNYADLAQIGIEYDFSPSPSFDQSKAGGPDFTAMSNAPFSVISPNSQSVHVTPVCGARALRRTEYFLKQDLCPPGFAHKSARGSFLNSRAAPMRLTFENTSLSELRMLTKRLLMDRLPVLTFSFHSTSLTKGASPYAPDEQSIADALDLMRSYFRFYVSDCGGTAASLEDLRELYPRSNNSVAA